MSRARLSLRDLVGEALAATMQRPGRTALTMLGTVLGVGTFVAVVGLTATVGGQISQRFNALMATGVVVEPGGADAGGVEDRGPAFPVDADQRVRAIDGVVDGGVSWTVDDSGRLRVTGAPKGADVLPAATPIVAGTPGYLRALRPTLLEGRLYDERHEAGGEPVVVLGSAAAGGLGITSLTGNPAVVIDGTPFTVTGIVSDVGREADTLFSAVVPRRTAEMLWGGPAGTQQVRMVIDTRLGAAGTTADQVAVALRPDAPELFKVTAPPDPTSLRDRVSDDLWGLFVLLAAVCLVIGAAGIANTSLVAVLERVSEIGLRRALGARRRSIAAQFLLESAITGTAGGLVGTSVGVLVVVAVAISRSWTAVLHPAAVLPAPLLGTAVGIIAGLYPAWRATRIEPVEALRR